MSNTKIKFTSAKNNKYYFVHENKFLLYLHPVMSYILENEDIINDLVKNNKKGVTIKEEGFVSLNEIKYYLNKISLIIIPPVLIDANKMPPLGESVAGGLEVLTTGQSGH